MRRSIVAVVVIALIIGAVVIVGQGRAAQVGEPRGNIRTTRIERGDLLLTVNATGFVAAERSVRLSFETPGVIQQVLVEEGQRVEAGQIMIRQDSTAQQLALRQAEAALDIARLTLEQLKAPVSEKDLAVADASVKAVEGTYNALLRSVDANAIKAAELRVQQASAAAEAATRRTKDIGGASGTNSLSFQLALAQEGQAAFTLEIAKIQLQMLKRGPDARAVAAARTRIDEAKAQRERLKAGVPQIQIERAQLAGDQAQVAVDQARRQLDNTALRAPFAGKVSSVLAKPGALTVNNLPALILVDGSRLHVDIKVDEVDIGQVKIGQPARFTLDALPGEALTGTIERIALAANQTATVTTYDVRVAIDKPGAPVRIGMTASATITVRELRDVLRVPNQFVRLDRRNNQAYVNLVNPDNSLSEIPVTLGLRTEEYSEILGGLNEGDIIGIDLNAGGFSIF